MKKAYQTEQRRQLVDFLRAQPDGQFTVEEIAGRMAGNDMPGKSTLYRLMNKLVEEGTVRRFVRGNSRQFFYQIVDGEHCDSHFHLKCIDCGKLIHLDEETSGIMQHNVLKQHHFEIDEAKTMLFGTCENCKYHKASKVSGSAGGSR